MILLLTFVILFVMVAVFGILTMVCEFSDFEAILLMSLSGLLVWCLL